MALNTHTYDPYFKEVFQSQILPNLPPLSRNESDNEWIEIFEEVRNYPHDIQNMCLHVYRLHSSDMNIGGYNCNLLGSQVWRLIKNNKDAKILFMEQFRDMITGYCEQGQSNRYLQVYKAFIPSHQPS
jgi:hypothetical protein